MVLQEREPQSPAVRACFSISFPGVECAVDINECEDGPCEHGAACEDGIADYTCRCVPSQNGTVWGGKNCSIQLTGCQTHDCQNEALCTPTYVAGSHGHLCQCQPGFYDATCSTPTTFSFASRTFLPIDMSTGDWSRKDGAGVAVASVSLRFRTTLPDAILFYRGQEEAYLFLELSGGTLHAGVQRNNSKSSLALAGLKVDDGQWHKAEVLLQDSVELKLWHESCDAGVCLQSAVVGDSATLLPPAFLKAYVGGVDGSGIANTTRSRQGYIGCLQDLQVDSQAVLPLDLLPNASSLAALGCDRTEWCQAQPCSHGGSCVDLWATFRCNCSRPYEGLTCSYGKCQVTALGSSFGNECSEMLTLAVKLRAGQNRTFLD